MATQTFNAGTLFSVPNLVAVITGGGSGLGAMTALALDANDARAVYILGRRLSSLESVASRATNKRVIPVECDVSSKSSLDAAVARIRDEVGFVNVVFANAGTSGPGGFNDLKPGFSVKDFRDTFWAIDSADWTKTLEVNVTGVWYTAIAFLELLDEGNKRAVVKQKSQILVTSSAGAFSRIPATGFDYPASKAGVLHLSKVMMTQFASFKIRVNVVAPGFYPSEMTEGHPFFGASGDPRIEGNISADKVPLERIGTEQDFAGAALFLLSEAGAFVNGSVLLTDGGRLGTIPSAY